MTVIQTKNNTIADACFTSAQEELLEKMRFVNEILGQLGTMLGVSVEDTQEIRILEQALRYTSLQRSHAEDELRNAKARLMIAEELFQEADANHRMAQDAVRRSVQEVLDRLSNRPSVRHDQLNGLRSLLKADNRNQPSEVVAVSTKETHTPSTRPQNKTSFWNHLFSFEKATEETVNSSYKLFTVTTPESQNNTG